MYLRALIVLLVAMNIGVALWWLLRPEAAAAPGSRLAPDVPRLVLASEAADRALDTAARDAANARAQAQAPLSDADAGAPGGDVDLDGLRCFSIGPWAQPADAGTALAMLQAQVPLARVREAPTGASGWQVMLPPQPDRDAAQAVVARLQAAGFNDHFIISQGADANAIALGRFGAEMPARRHEAALREAGFQAVAEALGATGSEAWIDLAADMDLDPEQVREVADAGRVEPLDCARLRRGSPAPR